MALLIVDKSRATSDDEMNVDIGDGRLTEPERDEMYRLGRVFPEAKIEALFRATPLKPN